MNAYYFCPGYVIKIQDECIQFKHTTLLLYDEKAFNSLKKPIKITFN